MARDDLIRYIELFSTGSAKKALNKLCFRNVLNQLTPINFFLSDAPPLLLQDEEVRYPPLPRKKIIRKKRWTWDIHGRRIPNSSSAGMGTNQRTAWGINQSRSIRVPHAEAIERDYRQQQHYQHQPHRQQPEYILVPNRSRFVGFVRTHGRSIKEPR